MRSRAKEIIADKALALAPRFGSIAFDASTTVGTHGRQAGPASGLIVSTNSYPTYATLKGTVGVTPILIGGETEESTDTFVGPLAVQAAQSLRYVRLLRLGERRRRDVRHHRGLARRGADEAGVRPGVEGDRAVRRLVEARPGGDRVAASTGRRSPVLITELAPTDERLDEYRGRVELR